MKKLGLVFVSLVSFAVTFAQESISKNVEGTTVSMATVKTTDSVSVKVSDTVRDVSKSDTVSESLVKPKARVRRSSVSSEVRAFNRMVSRYRKEYDALLERWDDIYLIIKDTRCDADYYKLAMPSTYYSASINQAFGIDGWRPRNPFLCENTLLSQLPPLKNLCHSADVDRYINRQMLSFYLEYPNLVKKNEKDFEGLEPIHGEEFVDDDMRKEIIKALRVPRQPKKVVQKDLLVYKPNFWTFAGSGYLHFSQNYTSGNWYQGGESSKSFLSGLTLQANYDDRQRIQFENKLEWKLGFITSSEDSLHSYKPNNDMLRLSSKLGLKAVNSWYYTLSAEFKTQFFSNYESNTDDLISSFFTPAELNMGLGMDYKFVKDGVCNLSVLLNPLNYTLYYVADNRVDPTDFNVKEGHNHESVWGSRIESTLKWQIFSSMMWESRLSYTTTYEKVVAEWENTFTFTINQYLSTKLFIHGRFDDGVTRDEGESYFQLQELLSFGLSYSW